jgi:hypothetical protein
MLMRVFIEQVNALCKSKTRLSRVPTKGDPHDELIG